MQEITRKSQLSQCHLCKVQVRATRLQNHMKKVHGLGVEAKTTVAQTPSAAGAKQRRATTTTVIGAKKPLRGGLSNEIVKPRKEKTSKVSGDKPADTHSISSPAQRKRVKRLKPVKGIILISRRGTRDEGGRRCDDCGFARSVVWRYAESSQGTIHLCGVCKLHAFDRSFGKIDALDMAFSGGAFESNRRRH